MQDNVPASPSRRQVSRRTFLTSSTLAAGAVSLSGAGVNAPEPAPAGGAMIRPQRPDEWRHKVDGMTYRRLGATGLMVSEIVMGGIPVSRESQQMIHTALELGVNYLDCASAYGRDSESERGYGQFFKENPGLRDRVFFTSKLSQFGGHRRQLYEDIFNGLPSEKQSAIVQRAAEIVAERNVGKAGVFFRYFPNQDRELDWEYRIVAMQRDFGHRVEGSGGFRRQMFAWLEESLGRTGAGYFDILFCPHGAAAPEALDEPEVLATLEEMRKQGKLRFTGVSSHTAYDQVTRRAADIPTYDMAMAAYNVINQGTMEPALAHAHARGLGFVAMKAGAAVMTHFDQLKPLAPWRSEKLRHLVPGDWTLAQKAYLFVLQNPHVSAVISNMWNVDMIRENTVACGKKVALNVG